MNEFNAVMTKEDLEKLKTTVQSMRSFLDSTLYPFKNTLANDWRRASELVAKIGNDQRKVDLFIRETENFVKEVNKLLGLSLPA